MTFRVPSGGGGGAPADATYVTLSTNATLTNERVLTGTSNQVVITDNGAGSTVVLSLPQDIATTSAPQFARIGIGAAAGAGAEAVIITQAVATSGSPTGFLFTAGAHTTLAASTEFTDVNFNLSATAQLSTGALAEIRSVRFQGRTYASVGASTIATASTVEIGPPIAGTNVTITNNRALKLTGKFELAQPNASTQMIFSTSNGNIVAVDVTASNTMLRLTGNRTGSAATLADVEATSNATRTAGSIFQVSNNTTARFVVRYTGGIELSQGVGTTGTLKSLSSTRANHLNQTASTAISDLELTAYTRQWATGAITLQPEIFFGIPTYAFVGASTITDAANLYIEGAPAAGTNATLTRSYALFVDAGNTRLDGNLLLGTTVAGATAANGVLALGNGATAPTGSADLVQLYAVDLSAGNASLGIFTETAVVTEAVVSDRTLTVKINGTNYKICLKV